MTEQSCPSVYQFQAWLRTRENDCKEQALLNGDDKLGMELRILAGWYRSCHSIAEEFLQEAKNAGKA